MASLSFASAVLVTISIGKFSKGSVEADIIASWSQEPGKFSKLKELTGLWVMLPSSDLLGRMRCKDASGEEQTEDERVAETDCKGVSVVSEWGEMHLRNCK